MHRINNCEDLAMQSTNHADTEAIRVMSYNICWGCMLGNKRGLFNSTAKALAKICMSSKHRINSKTKKAGSGKSCLQTVADHIDNAFPYHQLDFVGTQESANWDKLQRSSRVLRKMTVVHHLTSNGIVHFATFYNQQRWRLDAVKVGDLIYTAPENNKPETGRPYHILYLTELAHPDNKYIVINIHNGHHGGINRIISNLSTSPDLAITLPGNGKELESKKENAIRRSIITGHKFHVIMMGDFNDGNKDKYFKGFRPFAKSGISELKELRVSSQGITPPRTCCTPSGATSTIRHGIGIHAKPELNGDYILISNELEYVEPTYVPTGHGISYDARVNPASDHLPVIAIIRQQT